MNPWREDVADYLTIRRALGHKLERAGRLLPQFIDHLEDNQAATITVEHALTWSMLPGNERINWWAERLSIVRGFTSWLAAHDPSVEVPPAGLLGSRPRRTTPTLFSEADIAALLAATATIRSPLRAATYRTLLGLLAVTGMRIGEALALDRRDLDVDRGVLVVRSGKFGKARQLPLHHTTLDVLTGYLADRDDRLRPDADPDALFITTRGTRLAYGYVKVTFRQLIDRAGLQANPGSRPPRLHDLRHSFVVNNVLDAYRSGTDVPARLPVLSTYLGHVDPAATYWYLSAAPELLALAGQRLDENLDRP
jgi:integrase